MRTTGRTMSDWAWKTSVSGRGGHDDVRPGTGAARIGDDLERAPQGVTEAVEAAWRVRRQDPGLGVEPDEPAEPAADASAAGDAAPS